VGREADNEIVTQLSSKIRLRKWNEWIWTEVLKLVKLGLGDSTEDIVSWVKLTSLMDRSVMSATKARIFTLPVEGSSGWVLRIWERLARFSF
jgi:hypothetical protein